MAQPPPDPPIVAEQQAGADNVSNHKRDLTVPVAIITALAALAGSWGGASFNNMGLEQQFKNQRLAELTDVRRAEYVKFLQVADRAYRAPEGAEAEAAEFPLRDALAPVLIVGTSDVRDAAEAVQDAALGKGDYDARRNDFVSRVQTEADKAVP